MRDDETVLTRWSRRKLRSRAECAVPQHNLEASVATNGATSPAKANQEQSSEGTDSLPPIEVIDAGTDIRGFLSERVPMEVASAALRRAWTTDSTIRDFIGLSENSWDFNASGEIPGFGSIAELEVERIVTQFSGQPECSAVPSAAVSRTPAEDGCQMEFCPAGQPDTELSPWTTSALTETAAVPKQAAQSEAVDRAEMPAPRHRAHGRALPR